MVVSVMEPAKCFGRSVMRETGRLISFRKSKLMSEGQNGQNQELFAGQQSDDFSSGDIGPADAAVVAACYVLRFVRIDRAFEIVGL